VWYIHQFHDVWGFSIIDSAKLRIRRSLTALDILSLAAARWHAIRAGLVLCRNFVEKSRIGRGSDDDSTTAFGCDATLNVSFHAIVQDMSLNRDHLLESAEQVCDRCGMKTERESETDERTCRSQLALNDKMGTPSTFPPIVFT
jgi:hypothetical protein